MSKRTTSSTWVEGGGAIAAKVRSRLMAIVEKRARANDELANQGPVVEAGAAVIQRAAPDLPACARRR
jgi:phage tail protein X